MMSEREWLFGITMFDPEEGFEDGRPRRLRR